MNTSKSIILTNGETLVVKMFLNFEDELCYHAFCSSDRYNEGFSNDRGRVLKNETLDSITDELEIWLNDNINS